MPLPATAANVQRALRRSASPGRARGVAAFFKTAPGEYGHGDRFIGVSVPRQRQIARQFSALPLPQLDRLLASPVHEDRLTALLILTGQFRKARDAAVRARLFAFYRRRLARINNWDLVDTSAPQIVGSWLQDHPRTWLDRLARSPHLWSRRIAIMATFAFIQKGESRDTLRLARQLLDDPHELIHKATGWMLREVGKRVSLADLRGFLRRHAHRMPRTMLRYAIERLPSVERQRWLTQSRQRRRRTA